MDMSPVTNCWSLNFFNRAAVLLLCFYPIVAWMLTHRFRVAGGELSRASVPFALAPQFLGLAAAWRQMAQVLTYRTTSGGGIASTAAGLAEALVLLTPSLVVGAIVAFCFLVQSRRGGWHRSTGSFDAVSIPFATMSIAATVALARSSVVSPRFSVALAWALAALALLAALGVFVAAMRSVRTAGERVDGRPAFAIAIGVIVLCVFGVFVVRYFVNDLARIAFTGVQ